MVSTRAPSDVRKPLISVVGERLSVVVLIQYVTGETRQLAEMHSGQREVQRRATVHERSIPQVSKLCSQIPDALLQNEAHPFQHLYRVCQNATFAPTQLAWRRLVEHTHHHPPRPNILKIFSQTTTSCTYVLRSSRSRVDLPSCGVNATTTSHYPRERHRSHS